MNLRENTIFITGGTSGIGMAFAEEFLKLDNKVILCGRRQERLDTLKAKHTEIIALQCDVTDTYQRENLCKEVLNVFPNVNVVINNAGIQLATDLTHPVNLERVQEEININLISPIQICSYFAEHLARKHHAAIINISSWLAFTPIAFMPVYCATKAAIHSLTLSLRYQLRNTPVKVFEIIPPSTDTELGYQRRTDKTQTHGGMPVADFIKEAMKALKNDVYTAPIAQSKNFYQKREEMFNVINK